MSTSSSGQRKKLKLDDGNDDFSSHPRCSNLVKFSDSDYESFINGQFTDFLIKTVDGGVFKVHRLCLVRVPYFANMFKSTMKESTEKMVKEDIPTDVCRILLEYIYRGKSDKLDEYAEVLLTFADKYDMDCLIKDCVDSMKKTLSADNAARYFIRAKTLRLNDLEKCVLVFIEKNIDLVLRTDHWPGIADNFGYLTDVLRGLVAMRYSRDQGFHRNWLVAIPNYTEDNYLQNEVSWNILCDLPELTSSKRFYKFYSSDFVITDIRGINCTEYIMKVTYRASWVGSFTTVSLATRNCGSIHGIQPPPIGCKFYRLSSPVRELSWANREWEYISDLPYHHWAFVMPFPQFSDQCHRFILDHTFKITFGRRVHIYIPPQKIPPEQQAPHCSRYCTHLGRFDTKIEVRGTQFVAHKLALSAVSRRMAAVLSLPQPGYVLDDVSPEAFQGILDLIYECEKSPLTEHDQLGLFQILKTYGADVRLIENNERFLATKLTPENALRFLLCAAKEGASLLKSSAMKTIIEEAHTITSSESWKKMRKHEDLIVDMIEMISLIWKSYEKPIDQLEEDWNPTWSLLSYF